MSSAAAASSRRRALSLLKSLHRTAQTVFRGDLRAMLQARDKIEAEFRKNMHVKDQGAIEELIRHGTECNKFLRENVYQARRTEKGTYAVDIREEHLIDNIPFRAMSREEWREAAKNFRPCGPPQQQQETGKKTS